MVHVGGTWIVGSDRAGTWASRCWESMYSHNAVVFFCVSFFCFCLDVCTLLPHFRSFAVCLGKGLAMLEIKLGLAMILDVFETPVPKWEGKVIHGYT